MWVREHLQQITAAAEFTTRIGKLLEIEQYAVGPLRYLRFDYSTGDAAGQNMVGRATLAACEWIQQQPPRASPVRALRRRSTRTRSTRQINMLRTRGKRVVAEATLPADLLRSRWASIPEDLFWARQSARSAASWPARPTTGRMPPTAWRRCSSPPGQDVANIAESHAGIVYSQLLDSGDYYWSITLPALIVATVGGGTGLATQRECLRCSDATARARSATLAEICAAVVLAGEVSLSSAVMAGDWVTSHERLGRNRGSEPTYRPPGVSPA